MKHIDSNDNATPLTAVQLLVKRNEMKQNSSSYSEHFLKLFYE